ncbi:DUF431-domain-containing protein [Vararia minispora EC-137]|uniref:DUF431-domain-containing protein n=1 Tax=Vararia minispora EC-137 TaxID=1314806 RepID=A0ACB8Q692_9AGAM|nr:DUF431-domain-containing protein [Vararia minispora EC-137]
MGFTYVVEHMEEDDATPRALPRWVELEYNHMRTLAGPSASVEFTHLSRAAGAALAASFAPQDSDTALADAQCHTEGVLALMAARDVPRERVCLLDPRAATELAPADGDAFSWFLFGRAGDDPPRDRTGELRALGFPARRLGPVQMTTDTALGVTKLVVHDKIPLADIPYVDHPTIAFNERESVEMPFRYIADADGAPRLPPGMREHLYEDLNQPLDF